MISNEAIFKLLGISEKVPIQPTEMADKLNITFYPFDPSKQSREVLEFREQLESSLNKLKANIVPFEQSLTVIPLKKILKRIIKILFNNLAYFFFLLLRYESAYHKIPKEAIANTFRRRRIKKGISVIVTGDIEGDDLPMSYTSSFTESSIITIIDFPKHIDTDSEFHSHFDTAMGLFAHHMTNIILGVRQKEWLLYNFNASHPIFSRSEPEFTNAILRALIPKIVAPIRPHKFSEFTIAPTNFNPSDLRHKHAVEDLVINSALLEKFGLYPKGKNISDLPFRNEFYKWMGKLHLDNRNGMSYGFLARQMAVKIPDAISFEEACNKFGKVADSINDYFEIGGKFYITVEIESQRFVIEIPPIWVISQRSGANKLHMDPSRDLLKLGMQNGKLLLQLPIGLKLRSDYKPSFDTKVILSHALGNVIVASILKRRDPESEFARILENDGLAICHWHGYFAPDSIPKGWHVHGALNPHVACSSPQSAIYALQGKLQSLSNALVANLDYLGDIHIEPHHGTNMTIPSVKYLAKILSTNAEAAVLGNKYLSKYN